MVQIQRILPPERTITDDTGERQISTPSASGDIMRVYGKALQGVGQTIRDAALVVEKTKAQNERDSKMASLYSQAEQDPDTSPERQKYYEEEISRISSESARHITIPRERSLFELETKGAGDIAKIKVNNSFTKKRIEQGRVEGDIYVNNKKNDFLLARTPGEKKRAILERDLKIQELVKGGYIDKADATKQIDELNKNWAESQVNYDIMTDPLMAHELLKSKSYPNIDEEKRVELLAEAEQTIRQNTKQAELMVKINQDQYEEQMAGMMADNTLNLENINDFRGKISEKAFLTAKKAISSSDKVDPQIKAESFNSLQDQYVNLAINSDNDKTSASLDKIAEFRVNVMEAMGKGEITQENGQRFLKEVSVAFDQKAKEKVKKELGFWKSLGNWADKYATNIEETKQRATEQFKKRVEAGENPESVTQDIIKNEQIAQNPARAQYQIGDIIETPVGSVVVKGFYPDGEPDVELIK